MKKPFTITLVLLLTLIMAHAEKMNILFLAVDDCNTWLVADPNRYTGKVIAPAMQKLAQEGVLFRRAYTAAPKCSPSRAAILTGVAPWVSGYYQNAQALEECPELHAAVNLFRHFKNHGYYTASAGKITHSYPIGGDLDRFRPHTRDPVPPEKKGWLIHIPESEMGDTQYADIAIEELKKDHDKPFVIACGLFHPHSPWYVPQKYLDLYPVDAIKLPPRMEGDLNDIPEPGVKLADPKEHAKIKDTSSYQQKLLGYLASTSYADAQIGRVLKALDESPYRDNTIVVLWSDHGYHLGEKDHWGKGTLWEEGTHSLLMFKVPGMTQPNQVSHRIVSLLDIYPTLVELCGLPMPAHMDGHSLVPLLKDPNLPWDRPARTGYTEKWERDVFLSVRTQEYRYITYGDGLEEFYHCAKDPHEWTNLIDNPEYKKEIERHRAMLPADPAKAVSYGDRGE